MFFYIKEIVEVNDNKCNKPNNLNKDCRKDKKSKTINLLFHSKSIIYAHVR